MSSTSNQTEPLLPTTVAPPPAPAPAPPPPTAAAAGADDGLPAPAATPPAEPPRRSAWAWLREWLLYVGIIYAAVLIWNYFTSDDSARTALQRLLDRLNEQYAGLEAYPNSTLAIPNIYGRPGSLTSLGRLAIPRKSNMSLTTDISAFVTMNNRLPRGASGPGENRTTVAQFRISFKNATDLGPPRYYFFGTAVITPQGSLFGHANARTKANATDILGTLPPDVNRTAAIDPLKQDLDTYRSLVERWLSGAEREPRSDPDLVASACTWFVYAQTRPLNMTAAMLARTYDEYQNPTGLFVPKLPPLDSHWVLESANCNITLVTAPAAPFRGTSFMATDQRDAHLALAFLAQAAIKLFIAVRQIEACGSPSDTFKWSLFSLAGTLIIDSYYSVFYVYMTISRDDLVTVYMACSFFEVTHVLFFSWRFLSKVMAAHRFQPSILQPSTAKFVIFYIVVFGFNMFQLTMFDEARFPFIFGVPLVLLFSYPLPQIVRSAKHGSVPPGSVLWTLAGLAVRLLFPAYLTLCPDNLMTMGQYGEPYRAWMLGTLIWVTVQSTFLVSQRVLWPSWWMPRRFRVAYYDYTASTDEVLAHCFPATASSRPASRPASPTSPLRPRFEAVAIDSSDDEVEDSRERDDGDDHRRALMRPASHALVAAPAHELPLCAVCMAPLVDRREEVGRTRIARTPCGHFYHHECLALALEHRLSCPTCRGDLPPP
ncbi:hypothetical protein H9P43_000796 [Blastocladiella emersonii ATCC 22665]|nr:hypothetical protein H9P43_000796 [Blastocladiella emersonii ATCC 22665]